MATFERKNLSGELDSILSYLVNDDDLIKLLHYDCEDPFNQPNLTVAQKRALIGTKIIKRKSLKVLTNDSGSFVTFRLNHFLPSELNPNSMQHSVDFYVVCHNGTIETKDGERDLLLAEAICRIFYLQNTIGQGKPKLERMEDLVFDSNDFSGYLVSFIINDETQRI